MTKKPERCCKTCKHFVVPTSKTGRRIVRFEAMYKCDAPVADPVIPDSVKRGWGWTWPPSKVWMRGSQGTECMTWEARES